MILLLLACTQTPDSHPDSKTSKESSPNQDCYTLSPTDCAQNSTCTVITGEPVQFSDTAGGCYTVGPAEPMGCMPAGLGCGAAMTFGTSPDGCYQFRSTCTPSGFTTGGNVGICGANPNLDECS